MSHVCQIEFNNFNGGKTLKRLLKGQNSLEFWLASIDFWEFVTFVYILFGRKKTRQNEMYIFIQF